MIFQWPNIYIKPKKFYNEKKSKKIFLKKKIEKYFLDIYKHQNIVVPSARAGISLIIKYLKLERENEIFVNKWSTRCVLDTISSFSNPTTNIKSANAFIINHTWGDEKKLNLKKKKIIEDSADSIHLSPKSFFINDSKFEVISLPKIIGTYAGGVIFFKDKKFKNFIKEIKFDHKLSLNQSKLKFKFSQTFQEKYAHWQFFEHKNFDVDYNTLHHIDLNLENLSKNKNIISERQNIIRKKLDINFKNKSRLGPVVCLDVRKFKMKSKNVQLPIYHVNFSSRAQNTHFLRSFILPLHIGISDAKFDKIINNIIKR